MCTCRQTDSAGLVQLVQVLNVVLNCVFSSVLSKWYSLRLLDITLHDQAKTRKQEISEPYEQKSYHEFGSVCSIYFDLLTFQGGRLSCPRIPVGCIGPDLRDRQAEGEPHALSPVRDWCSPSSILKEYEAELMASLTSDIPLTHVQLCTVNAYHPTSFESYQTWTWAAKPSRDPVALQNNAWLFDPRQLFCSR